MTLFFFPSPSIVTVYIGQPRQHDEVLTKVQLDHIARLLVKEIRRRLSLMPDSPSVVARHLMHARTHLQTKYAWAGKKGL
jgi:hypothetical protein